MSPTPVNPKRDPEFEPRNRIVGAIALVAVGVLLLSVILSEQPQMRATDAPPAADPNTRVVVTEMPSPPPSPKTPGVSVRPAAQPPVIKRAAIPRETAAPKPKPKPKTVVKPRAKWLVQVGIFSEPANARRLRDRLKGLKYSATLRSARLNDKRVTKVLVGPYVSRDKARDAKAAIQRKTGLRGVVVSRD